MNECWNVYVLVCFRCEQEGRGSVGESRYAASVRTASGGSSDGLIWRGDKQ